jgi:hypothetical protein
LQFLDRRNELEKDRRLQMTNEKEKCEFPLSSFEIEIELSREMTSSVALVRVLALKR